MWFKNKKDVDLRDLQRKGLIRIPKKEIEVETDRNGFVDMSSKNLPQENLTTDNLTSQNPEQGFFNFMDNTSSKIPASSSNSDEKRMMTRKIEDLDNKIYKLEQRIELLERKVGVGNSSSYSWQ